MQFSNLNSSKMQISEIDLFGTLTIQKDKISYVKHVLAPLYVFFIAARREVMLQLMRLAAHCRDLWAWRLQTPARMRPLLSDRFLMDCFPRPLEGGPSVLPYARRPAASRSRHHSAVALRGRAAARRARSAWNMERHLAPGAGAWARASAAAAGQATKATPAPRQATAAPGPHPAYRRDAKSSSPKPGARGRPPCHPG